MKKTISFLLAFILLFSISSCGNDVQPSSVNPYEAIEIPENIKFGMNSHELIENLDSPVPSEVGESGAGEIAQYSTGENLKKNLLNNECYVFSVKYILYDDKNIEFEDNYELTYITFNIVDGVSYGDRTSSYHGDIEAEYETIKNMFTDTYGAPLVEEQTSYKDRKTIIWETDTNIGITLTLESLTSYSSRGEMTVKYADTTKLKQDWYLT